MEKMQADFIIEYYMRPMYGFALKKSKRLITEYISILPY